MNTKNLRILVFTALASTCAASLAVAQSQATNNGAYPQVNSNSNSNSSGSYNSSGGTEQSSSNSPSGSATQQSNSNLPADTNSTTPASSATPAQASTPQPALEQKVAAAANCVTTLQSRTETGFPTWVVNNAKGVLIIHRWSGGAVIGGTVGWAVGLEKTPTGAFSNPAFYTFGGASVGAQLGGSEIETVAFLMSDKAVRSLTENKFVWSGNLHAVAGGHSSAATTVDNNTDIILYQKSNGLDVGATVAAAKLSVDDQSNHAYYGNSTITPAQIFSGQGTAPDSAKSLVEALKKLPQPMASNS